MTGSEIVGTFVVGGFMFLTFGLALSIIADLYLEWSG